jgi:hypothetical protein
MSNTGFAPFTTTVDKTNKILHEIEDALGWPRKRPSCARCSAPCGSTSQTASGQTSGPPCPKT